MLDHLVSAILQFLICVLRLWPNLYKANVFAGEAKSFWLRVLQFDHEESRLISDVGLIHCWLFFLFLVGIAIL